MQTSAAITQRKVPNGHRSFGDFNAAVAKELLEVWGTVDQCFQFNRGAGDFSRMFLCVDCCVEVTTPIVRYFRMQPYTIKCYQCQQF